LPDSGRRNKWLVVHYFHFAKFLHCDTLNLLIALNIDVLSSTCIENQYLGIFMLFLCWIWMLPSRSLWGFTSRWRLPTWSSLSRSNIYYWPHMLLLLIQANLIKGLLHLVTKCVYRLYFHPLAKYPGPKVAALTDVCICIYCWQYDNAYCSFQVVLLLVPIYWRPCL
jgi:hypothetical protein